MIDDFLRRHSMTTYRLSRLLNVPAATLHRWRKGEPKHPLLTEMALAELERRMHDATNL